MNNNETKSNAISLVKFASKNQDGFYDAIKLRVNEYFDSQNISRYSNTSMYIKTAAMLVLYFGPLLLIITGIGFHHPVLYYALWVLMGVGIAGIGCSVMHDSNHGSYSRIPWLNNMLGGLLNVLGGYARNWKIQHNILHHTYTNVEGLDEDIDAGILLRMSPQKEWRSFHRFQHIYAWLLYGIMNLFWVTVKDYNHLFKYHRNGMLNKQKITLRRALIELSLLKIAYFGYIVVAPIVFTDVPWYHVVCGFVVMHLVGGLILACVFQLAHVMETSEFPQPLDNRRMENSWAVHQLLNTTNFAPRSKVLSWFIGGLNYQIEHHLFPHICHVHYPRISAIVRQTALEFNLPYNVQPNFIVALREHKNMLRKLGQPA